MPAPIDSIPPARVIVLEETDAEFVPVVNAIYDRHADAILANRDGSGMDLGVSRLTARLESLGVVAGRPVVMALRERLITEAVRRSLAAGLKPAIVPLRMN